MRSPISFYSIRSNMFDHIKVYNFRLPRYILFLNPLLARLMSCLTSGLSSTNQIQQAEMIHPIAVRYMGIKGYWRRHVATPSVEVGSDETRQGVATQRYTGSLCAFHCAPPSSNRTQDTAHHRIRSTSAAPVDGRTPVRGGELVFLVFIIHNHCTGIH